MTDAIGYARVSTREQGDHGHGLDAQAAAINEAAARHGYNLLDIKAEVVSTRKKFRPLLAEAIAEVRDRGGVLIAHKVTRPARSMRELLALHDQSIAEGWHLLTLDLEYVDTTTPQGKAFLGMMAVFAEFERDVNSERTREGMASAAINGTKTGRDIGRPTAEKADRRPEERERELVAVERVSALRVPTEYGLRLSIRKIAEVLNEEGIPSIRGGSWRAKNVHRLIHDHNIV